MSTDGARIIATAGADPGPTTGLLLAAWDRETCALLLCHALECTAGQAPGLLELMLAATPYGPAVTHGGIEAFVTRGKSQSLRGVSVAAVQAEITDLAQVAAAHGVLLTARPAAEVKPWAGDRRLAAAGLLEPTERFADARDAGRHALYTACQCGLPDPLGAVARAARRARA